MVSIKVDHSGFITMVFQKSCFSFSVMKNNLKNPTATHFPETVPVFIRKTLLKEDNSLRCTILSIIGSW